MVISATLSLFFAMVAAHGTGDPGRCQDSGVVRALFDLGAPQKGPFPSDWWTVPDAAQNTRLRVNLPLPDPILHPSDREDVQVLNTMDGFNLQPRLSIPFDGPINLATVTRGTVFLISLGSTLPHGVPAGRVIGINQVVWDSFTNMLHVDAEELLDQHTRYALIVTREVKDTGGAPVAASDAFRQFRQWVPLAYEAALLDALHAARRLGVREEDIAVASVFTTLSSTAVMEKIRDQIKAATPAPADFLLGAGGKRTVFALDRVTSVTWRQQNRHNPPGFVDVPIDLASFGIVPSVVGPVAFGKYVAPSYRTVERFIPEVGTRTGTPAVQGTEGIYFNLFLPAGPKPGRGWPVALHGLGAGSNKEQSLTIVAKLAEYGIATMLINAVGRGFGPLGTLTVNADGPVTFLSGGRGSDVDANGVIADREGEGAAPPRTIIANRDGQRQTVIDYLQLVRVIEVGVDVDGDTAPDLDPSRIYYAGWSLGANNGTTLFALEPSIRAAALYSQAGPLIEQLRLSGRENLGAALARRTPPLLNSPGIIRLDGRQYVAPFFNENMPLRDGLPLTIRLADQTDMVIQSPVINTVPGAMEIQEVVDNSEWVSQSGNQVAYARHLRRQPLAGVPVRPVLYLYAKGDQLAPNPNGTAVIRAGDVADRVTFYRHDLAFAEDSSAPLDPHGFVNLISSPSPLVREVARGAQNQIATFLASDGTTIIHPEPARLFEVPILLPLPESLNFIPLRVFGTSSPGCTGPLRIGVNSMPRIGNGPFALTCNNAPLSGNGLLVLGTALATPIRILDIQLWVGDLFLASPTLSDGRGAGYFSLPLPADAKLVGARFSAQFAWVGPTSPLPCPPLGVSASNALEVTIVR